MIESKITEKCIIISFESIEYACTALKQVLAFAKNKTGSFTVILGDENKKPYRQNVLAFQCYNNITIDNTLLNAYTLLNRRLDEKLKTIEFVEIVNEFCFATTTSQAAIMAAKQKNYVGGKYSPNFTKFKE